MRWNDKQKEGEADKISENKQPITIRKEWERKTESKRPTKKEINKHTINCKKKERKKRK